MADDTKPAKTKDPVESPELLGLKEKLKLLEAKKNRIDTRFTPETRDAAHARNNVMIAEVKAAIKALTK